MPRSARACLLAVLLVASCRSGPATPELLLLLTVDTLRADRLGSYGSDRGLTPRLDALARDGTRFDAAYAPASVTLPSLTALLTGRYPETLGVRSNASALPAAVPTLAGELRNRGWRTGAVVSNQVLRRSAGLARGFERYDDRLPDVEAVRRWPERVARDTTEDALRVLDALRAGAARGVFLWVHYQDPHGPYTPPAPLRERHLARERAAPDGARELPVQPGDSRHGAIPAYQVIGDERRVAFYRAGYDAEVSRVDEAVGHLLEGLEARSLRDRTLLAFAADHGEALGEDDYWFAHGEYLTDPLVRVPLFLHGQGVPRERRDEPVALLDLFPTLLHAAGAEPPSPAGPGRDLLAAGASLGASTPYLATLGGSRVARFGLVEGPYKYVVSLAAGRRVEQISRRDADGPEVVLEAPALARRMRRSLAKLRRGLGETPPENRRALAPEDREALRALGYAEDGG